MWFEDGLNALILYMDMWLSWCPITTVLISSPLSSHWSAFVPWNRVEISMYSRISEPSILSWCSTPLWLLLEIHLIHVGFSNSPDYFYLFYVLMIIYWKFKWYKWYSKTKSYCFFSAHPCFSGERMLIVSSPCHHSI